jgi:hypothetical protein
MSSLVICISATALPQAIAWVEGLACLTDAVTLLVLDAASLQLCEPAYAATVTRLSQLGLLGMYVDALVPAPVSSHCSECLLPLALPEQVALIARQDVCYTF